MPYFQLCIGTICEEPTCCEHPLGQGSSQLILIQVEQRSSICQRLIPPHRHHVIARAVEFDVAQPQDRGQQEPNLFLQASNSNALALLVVANFSATRQPPTPSMIAKS